MKIDNSAFVNVSDFVNLLVIMNSDNEKKKYMTYAIIIFPRLYIKIQWSVRSMADPYGGGCHCDGQYVIPLLGLPVVGRADRTPEDVDIVCVLSSSTWQRDPLVYRRVRPRLSLRTRKMT